MAVERGDQDFSKSENVVPLRGLRLLKRLREARDLVALRGEFGLNAHLRRRLICTAYPHEQSMHQRVPVSFVTRVMAPHAGQGSSCIQHVRWGGVGRSPIPRLLPIKPLDLGEDQRGGFH